MIAPASQITHGAFSATSSPRAADMFAHRDTASIADIDSEALSEALSESDADNEALSDIDSAALMAADRLALRLALSAMLRPGMDGSESNPEIPSDRLMPSFAASDIIAEKLAATIARTAGNPSCNALIPRLADSDAIAEKPAERLAASDRFIEILAVALSNALIDACNDSARSALMLTPSDAVALSIALIDALSDGRLIPQLGGAMQMLKAALAERLRQALNMADRLSDSELIMLS